MVRNTNLNSVKYYCISMYIQEAIVKRIIELSNLYNISYNAMALKAGLPPSTLKNILNGDSKNTGIITIKIICDGLDITIKEFFNSDLFNDLEQEVR